MTSPVYTFTVPAFIKGLTALTQILKEAESHATKNNIPLADFVNARLYDDMKPLSYQVQVATDLALKGVARPTHTDPVDRPHSETTFEELYARIDKTLEILNAVDPAAYTGKEKTPFKAPFGPTEVEFTAETYAANFALPNFYFHLTTAYAIFRAKGVPLGKLVYLKPFLS
ncbi:hypothetical protein EYZ11_004412 [Aspergillus tanneri]|uniref:DUF1993 domain-containing protein n=1 Tax=Aspergillus tanneri TaxID=1220188 RepID=A0A4S3JL52_9EURO|nr:uncharacterized protein ATNIH1004_007739 [Aspergillus tanneri]KAA8646312.1 hypothetical protein ATNIH1004_007739 [Aspergillus tanneri]THC96090.1 hypothetical protein EYZ11_004412 [Aspergillus tanneri]